MQPLWAVEVEGPVTLADNGWSGSYRFPWDINLAGTYIGNSGYPYVSTVTVTRAQAQAVGVNLTRATQPVLLSERGDERLDSVKMVDLRLSKIFRLGSNRSFTPQVDLFNLFNADTTTTINNGVGNTYLFPGEILSPRIIRVGFVLNF